MSRMLIFVIVAVLLLAGCGQPANTAPPTAAATTAPTVKATTAPPAQATPAPTAKATTAPPTTAPTAKATTAPAAKLPDKISYATLPMGTASNAYAIAQADVIKRHTGIEVYVEPIPNPVAILTQVFKTKQNEMGFANGFHVWYSYLNRTAWAPNVENARILYRYTYLPFGYIVRADSGIKSIADLKGKKVYVNWPANKVFNQDVNEAMLGAFGLTMKDITPLDYSSPPEAIRNVIEGKAPAAWDSLRGGAMHEEMARTVGGYVLPFPNEPKYMDSIKKKSPYMEPATVTAGIDPLAKETTPVLSDNIYIWVNKDMSDDLAYTLVKTLIENVDELARINPDLADGTLKNALIGPIAPYHPGVIRYFKEKGVWGSDMDNLQAKLLEQAK